MCRAETSTRTVGRSGVAAVEFAALAPVLITLLLGMWEIGRLIQVKHVLDNAAREGARQAASGTKRTEDITTYVSEYLRQSRFGKQELNSLGSPTGEFQTVSATITVVNKTMSSRSDPRTALQNDQFEVTVTVPLTEFQWIGGRFYSADNLTATATWTCLTDQPLANLSETIPG